MPGYKTTQSCVKNQAALECRDSFFFFYVDCFNAGENQSRRTGNEEKRREKEEVASFFVLSCISRTGREKLMDEKTAPPPEPS